MDRKAWIVVTICSILLAYSYFLQKQNAALLAEQAKEEKEAIEKVDDLKKPDPVTGEVPPTDLTVEKQVPQREVVKSQLETETNTFTLSSRQGGIVDSLFKDEKAVKDLTKNVRMNDLGEHEIGAILSRSGEMLETTYTVKELSLIHI